MARDAKIEVAAINLRIPADKKRDYNKLVSAISGLRRGIKVYGDSYVAITYYNESDNRGLISKYTEIDINGEWFSLEDFDTASPEDVSKIVIPERLKPNFSQFYFYLDLPLHSLIFETYSQSKGLSANSVEKYFRAALATSSIREEFGLVEVDVIKSYGQVSALLNLPDLKELRIIIKSPNSDDLGEDLAHVIEERLKEQNGSEYEEKIKAKGEDSLRPNERTKRLADVAADNGEVKTKSLINGVLTESTTVNHPLVEVETYKPEEAETSVFMRLAKRIAERISTRRAATSG